MLCWDVPIGCYNGLLEDMGETRGARKVRLIVAFMHAYGFGLEPLGLLAKESWSRCVQ